MFLFMYVYVCMCVCICTCGRLLDALDPLELELQAFMNHKVWCYESNRVGPLQEQTVLVFSACPASEASPPQSH